MRIDGLKPARHIARMEDEIDDEMMDEAERLALAAFGPGAEVEHIEAVYDSLIFMKNYRLPPYRAMTLH